MDCIQSMTVPWVSHESQPAWISPLTMSGGTLRLLLPQQLSVSDTADRVSNQRRRGTVRCPWYDHCGESGD